MRVCLAETSVLRRFGDAAVEVITAHVQVLGEDHIPAMSDDHVRGAGAHVDEEGADGLIALAAEQMAEAFDERYGLDVNADDFEFGFGE